MRFLDRKEELEELKRICNQNYPPSLAVVFGRRRLGKSTLIKKALKDTDVYYVAADVVDHVQLAMIKSLLEEKFPEIRHASFSSWEDLLKLINSLTREKFTLCLDEFPYIVTHSPELPSVIQRLIDSKELKFNIIICGSSQRMMQNLVLSASEPLYGRARLLMDIRPIPIAYLQEALDIDAVETVEEHSVWGGVPRYWELREDYRSLKEAIKHTMLSPFSVLYDEPHHLFLDEMSATVQSESLMSVIASGANRLSEIASRMGREATSLSAPLDKLIRMNYLRRETPFGESPKKSKKGLYRINDPLMDFHYTFIVPNISNIGRGRRDYVMEEIEKRFNLYVSRHWEILCREAVSGNMLFGIRWGEASRWWGNVKRGNNTVQMEIDLLALSADGSRLLVGECKWTSGENVENLHRELRAKASDLPFAKGKHIVPVLFLKSHTAVPALPDIHILYPDDIIPLV